MMEGEEPVLIYLLPSIGTTAPCNLEEENQAGRKRKEKDEEGGSKILWMLMMMQIF